MNTLDHSPKIPPIVWLLLILIPLFFWIGWSDAFGTGPKRFSGLGEFRVGGGQKQLVAGLNSKHVHREITGDTDIPNAENFHKRSSGKQRPSVSSFSIRDKKGFLNYENF